MKIKKVYLAGGIYEVDDPRTWRVEATKMLSPDWEAMDPVKLEMDPYSMPALDLVRFDYGIILQCRAVLAKAFTPSWGTAMEIKFAHEHNIPVIAWVKDSKGRQSQWLNAHVFAFVDTLPGAVQLLEVI